jgi:GR25 family glycosyltransferase involved in LPS biosynthesis
MRIGITVDMRHSMFSAGHPNSCIAICEAMQVGGHEVILLTRDSEKIWWDDVSNISNDYTIQSIDKCSDIDILIEVAFHPTPIQRGKLCKKAMWYCRKPALFTDMESTVFTCRVDGRNLEGVSEIWVADLFNSSDDIEYLKMLYPSLYVRMVPWLWSPTIVEGHRKEKQSPVWPQVIEHSKDSEWSLHITETNTSNTSSCTLPLLMLKGSGITRVLVHNMEALSKSKFFNENILDNCSLPSSLQLIGRQRVIDWSNESKSLILSHSRFVKLKMANLEAAWVGIPLVHNNEVLVELGCGLEELYYSSNSISDALKNLKKILDGSNKDNYMYNIDILSELRKRILYRFSPEAKASEWLSLLEEKSIPLVTPKKVYTILFTDMWSDFNAEHNMFTLAIQEYFKEYCVKGVSNLSEKADVHIFGPFGKDWMEVKGIPKIHFTGENTGPIEHPLVKLNIGYKNLQENYLRMPLWMFEIDLFGADLQRIQNPLPLPLDRCMGVNLQTRPKFCAFVVSNPKNQVRNEAFHMLNKYKPVDSAGRLFNNVGSEIFAGLGGGGGELKKHEFLRQYKFCLCYENEIGDGYVTEKILHAKAAGCIPIYWGSSDVVKDFDPLGFIHIRDPSELVARVREIDEDDDKWFQMASVPAISSEKMEEVKNMFSKMSKKIVGHGGNVLVTASTLKFWPALERWLKNVELFKNLKAIVYVGSDVPEKNLEILKKDFVTVRRFPVDCPPDFPDFWEPQHFAWKLWILKNISEDPMLYDSNVLYMDCGSVIIRWPSEWIRVVQEHKISFLDDTNQTNGEWCHTKFCEALNVTEEEKKSNQIAACLILFKSGDPFVVEFFKEALRIGSIRDVIVGEKWSGKLPNVGHLGHRHDQSILSILGQRRKIHRYNINKIYNHTSARATFYGGQHIYVHRGDYKTHVPLIEGIDDAYVINLDRRQDRLKSFVEHHPYFRGKVRRHKAVDGKSLELSKNLVGLFGVNDFFWKKAVMGCALSHLKLWTMLLCDTSEIQSYLIMEDDARLDPGWKNEWSKIYSKIPDDWECIYLGGVLPPNKDGFKEVLEQTRVPGLCRIAPNTFFGQSVPSRQFHFCAYAYVLSRAGVKKIIKSIEEHKGIWTSADHVLFNSLNKEHVYVVNPLLARASQEDDPNYVNSDFNDFSRVDKFDSDLWNNDERFSKEEISRNTAKDKKIEIIEAVNEVYVKPLVNKPRFVSLDICSLTSETIYETRWLEELFRQEIKIEQVAKDTDLRGYSNLIVCLIRSKWNEQLEWLNTIAQNFKVIHLSDEFEKDPVFFYEAPNITGVLRFYVRKDVSNKKVLTIPLGYHWSNNNPIKPLTNRRYIWSFCGTNWNNRSSEMKVLEDLQPNRVEYYNEWNSSSQLNEQDYLDLLSDTIFVPCPRGNNTETFRFYEVLEQGCIPVFTELPVVLENSGIPFLETKTWREVVELIEHLNKNIDELVKYQASILDGWLKYKESLRKDVSSWLSLAV